MERRSKYSTFKMKSSPLSLLDLNLGVLGSAGDTKLKQKTTGDKSYSLQKQKTKTVDKSKVKIKDSGNEETNN